MDFESQVPPALAQEFKDRGLWPGRLVTDALDGAVAQDPDRPAVTGYSGFLGATTRHTYGELAGLAERIALGLVAHGIRPGDVVSVQLPNCWHLAALHLACVRIGAVINPLMPIFRHRELTYMLSFAEAKVIFVPAVFRAFDYPRMIAELRGDVPSLARVFVVGGDGADSFEGNFLGRPPEDAAEAGTIFESRRPAADDVTLLMYTSGTTGEPKGIMHTHNTLLGNVAQYVERVGLGADDVVLMASPLAHLTGFLYGLVMPIVLGARAVLMDVWAADAAARIIDDERVTFTMAATPFLHDLTETPALEECDLGSLHTFLTAGAPIPRVLVERATARLGVLVISCWGMTENGAVTTTARGDPPEKVFGTDGKPIEGMEVRVVDGDGKPLPAGDEGRLQARGMASFVGYLNRPELYATDAEGWLETGDKARLDAEGYIRITGRNKDVIIRGGENIPVVEVEELLYRHGAVEEVAIVAMPDDRLGERACAFVTLRPGAALSFADMIAFLEGQKIAKTYLPERLEIIAEMPRTPSGKIQKFRLRQTAAAFSVLAGRGASSPERARQ